MLPVSRVWKTAFTLIAQRRILGSHPHSVDMNETVLSVVNGDRPKQ
jgi:hypothetical protein